MRGLCATATILVVAATTLIISPARADSLTLDQAIELALTKNERAAIADLNVVQAEAAVSRARVAFMPVLSASGNGTLKPLDKAPIDTASGNLTVNQPLLVWSAFPLLDQAKHALGAEQHQAVDDKRQLAFDTAKAYFAVLLADKVLEAAQKKLDTANADVADTDAQSKAQLVSSNDVTRARISLSSSVRELVNDKGSLDSAVVQLEFMINAKVATPLVEPTAVLTAGNAPVPDPAGLVHDALAVRPDLLAHKDSALAAHDFAREPHMRFYPTLALQGQMSATSNASGGGHTIDGSISLTAQWSIYDGGSRDADARSRDAAAAIADLNTDTLVRSIDANVRTNVAQLIAAQQARVAAKDAADSARKSADETAILYKQGLAKAIELVDANEQRFVAEVTYAEADYSVATAHLALRQAMGLGPIGDVK